MKTITYKLILVFMASFIASHVMMILSSSALLAVVLGLSAGFATNEYLTIYLWKHAKCPRIKWDVSPTFSGFYGRLPFTSQCVSIGYRKPIN